MAVKLEQNAVFDGNQLEQIRATLSRLRDRTHAHSLILVDPVGLPVIWLSQVTDSEVMSLSTLAAGGFVAASEMSRYVKLNISFSGCYYEGVDCHIYTLAVADGFLLFAAYDQDVRLGPVRLFARQAAEALVPIIWQAAYAKDSADTNRQIDPEFGAALSDKLELLFGGLESLNGG
jgi:predicted regulator of Ras-like GTPase activity (Roadblock/LC7/MglB family)